MCLICVLKYIYLEQMSRFSEETCVSDCLLRTEERIQWVSLYQWLSFIEQKHRYSEGAFVSNLASLMFYNIRLMLPYWSNLYILRALWRKSQWLADGDEQKNILDARCYLPGLDPHKAGDLTVYWHCSRKRQGTDKEIKRKEWSDLEPTKPKLHLSITHILKVIIICSN